MKIVINFISDIMKICKNRTSKNNSKEATFLIEVASLFI